MHISILAGFLIVHVYSIQFICTELFFLDSAFTYRMLQVIHDEDGQAHIVDADSSIPVDLFSDIKRKSKMLVENH